MTETRQEKNYREIVNSLAKTEVKRDAAIDHLVRVANVLRHLQQTKRRLEKAMAKPKPEPKPQLPVGEPLSKEMVIAVTQAIGHAPVNASDDDLKVARQFLNTVNDELPAFLDRRKIGADKDAAARAEIERDNAERKRTKSLGRVAKMKAKSGGALSAMPLTGKAALAKIRAG